MKNTFSIALLFLLTLPLFTTSQQPSKRLTDYVNPFIGTGAIDDKSLSGCDWPGATMPFGMVQLSPDTRDTMTWEVTGGYDYKDKSIAGFTHTHLNGTGVPDMFDVLVMPYTGKLQTLAGDLNKPGSGYHSSFSHNDEKARPGYYQVKLTDYNINAELTATTHAGFHRYTFPANSEGHVIFDLNHSVDKTDGGWKIINAQIRIINDHAIEGYRLITGWAKLRKIYFYAEFSKPIINSLFADGKRMYENNSVVNGRNLRAVFDFNTNDSKPLLIKVGISAVSMENAQLNVKQEIPAWDFDKTVADAGSAWENELKKIQVEGTEAQKEIFYTAMYHTCIQPNTMSDVNGDYTAIDYSKKQIGKGNTYYSTFSLWDTYRAAHPLYTITQQQRTTDFVNSLIQQYEDYGYLPIWQLWGQENYCMIGNHAIPVIVDAVMKGIPGIDIDKAYEAVKNSSVRSHPNSPFNLWEKYKYMPENIQTQSVSITLEMCYNDWCVAQLAKKLGKTEDYNHFTERSEYYKNIFNDHSKFFQAKDDKGNWLEHFNPFEYGGNGGHPITEGNAWQYFWYVPQNVENLIQLTGGKNAFINKLDSFFTLSYAPKDVNGNASGFIGQYAHGNEPSHHITYLYNYAGAPWKTQFYANKVLTEMYNNTSSGYSGNEDCGQMSSWYIFSAMGFYPVNPANGIYAIGSPLLAKSVINLAGGKSFTIIAKKKSEKDIYIQSARLNGKPFNSVFITHNDIMNGGTLTFEMGDQPNKKWGVSNTK